MSARGGENGERGQAARVLVVIPAYNEARSIGRVIKAVRAEMPHCDVLVVNDGSTDATDREAQLASAHVASHPFNIGVGGAMRTGFQYARQNDYDALVQVDADGQHDATAVPYLLEELQRSDIVIGTRFHTGADYAVGAYRRAVMWMFAKLSSAAVSSQITDATSGFRAHGRRAIGVFADHYPAEYLGDTVESLVIASRVGLTVTEVPVTMNRRQHGKSSQRVATAPVSVLRTFGAMAFGVVRSWPAIQDVTP